MPSNATPIESILLFTDGAANKGCENYSTIRSRAEGDIRKIKSNSTLVSIERHITLSVIAYGTEPPVALKSLSDACDGLYFPIHLSDPHPTMEDLPLAFARIFGFSSTTADNNINLKIQAGSQVILQIIYSIVNEIIIIYSKNSSSDTS